MDPTNQFTSNAVLKQQSILKQKMRLPLQEVDLPDIRQPDPLDDETTTTTVTRSRRVSFGTNLKVKEFIVGSAVSTQCISEYEQAFSSSDSSNQNSSRSACGSQLLESTFVTEDNLRVITEKSPINLTCNKSVDDRNKRVGDRGDYDFDVSTAENFKKSKTDLSYAPEKLKKRESVMNQSMTEKPVEKASAKFHSTVCFSSDSPSADLEFTAGCINLAKSILNKKKKELTLILKETPKEPEADDNSDKFHDTDKTFTLAGQGDLADILKSDDEDDEDDPMDETDVVRPSNDSAATPFDRSKIGDALNDSDDSICVPNKNLGDILGNTYTQATTHKATPKGTHTVMLNTSMDVDDTFENVHGGNFPPEGLADILKSDDDDDDEPMEETDVICPKNVNDSGAFNRSEIKDMLELTDESLVCEPNKALANLLSTFTAPIKGDYSSGSSKSDSFDMTQEGPTDLSKPVQQLNEEEGDGLDTDTDTTVTENEKCSDDVTHYRSMSKICQIGEENKRDSIDSFVGGLFNGGNSVQSLETRPESESQIATTSDDAVKATETPGMLETANKTVQSSENRPESNPQITTTNREGVKVTETPEDPQEMPERNEIANESVSAPGSENSTDALQKTSENLQTSAISTEETKQSVPEEMMEIESPVEILQKETGNVQDCENRPVNVSQNEMNVTENLQKSKNPSEILQNVTHTLNILHSESNVTENLQKSENPEKRNETLNKVIETDDENSVNEVERLQNENENSILKLQNRTLNLEKLQNSVNLLEKTNKSVAEIMEVDDPAEIVQNEPNVAENLQKSENQIGNETYVKKNASNVLQNKSNITENLHESASRIENETYVKKNSSNVFLNESNVTESLRKSENQIGNETYVKKNTSNVFLNESNVTENLQKSKTDIDHSRNETYVKKNSALQTSAVRENLQTSKNDSQISQNETCGMKNGNNISQNEPKIPEVVQNLVTSPEPEKSPEEIMEVESPVEIEVTENLQKSEIRSEFLQNKTGSADNSRNVLQNDPNIAEKSQAMENCNQFSQNRTILPENSPNDSQNESNLFKNLQKPDEFLQNGAKVTEMMDRSKDSVTTQHLHDGETVEIHSRLDQSRLIDFNGSEAGNVENRREILQSTCRIDRSRLIASEESKIEMYFANDSAISNYSAPELETNVSLMSTPESNHKSVLSTSSPESIKSDLLSSKINSERGLSSGDVKNIKVVNEISQETGCTWKIVEFNYPKTGKGFWSFGLDFMDETEFIVKIEIDPCEIDSIDSYSTVIGIDLIHPDYEELFLTAKERAVTEYGIQKLQVYVTERKNELGTINSVPLFLDCLNSYFNELKNQSCQILTILQKYPGSELSNHKLSFRLYSFPLMFSSTVFIDLNCYKTALVFETDFGNLDKKKITEVFERCLKGNNSLVDFVIMSNKYVIDLEKVTGKLTKRNHVKLLEE